MVEKTPLEKQKEEIEALKMLLSRDREEVLKKMSPEKRELYERTLALQKRIGKGKFDVVAAIRKLRSISVTGKLTTSWANIKSNNEP